MGRDRYVIPPLKTYFNMLYKEEERRREEIERYYEDRGSNEICLVWSVW